MRLTNLYTIQYLSAALARKYGADALLKTTESKNSDGEDTITVTIVKSDKAKQEKIAKIVGALKKMGLEVMHFPAKALLAYEIGNRIGEDVVTVEELDIATEIFTRGNKA